MEFYKSDDVANALNNVIGIVLAPLIATHPCREHLYERFERECFDARDSKDLATVLARSVLEHLLNSVDRDVDAGSSPD